MIPFKWDIDSAVEWRYTTRGKLNRGAIQGIDRDDSGRPVYLVRTEKGIRRAAESLLRAVGAAAQEGTP